MAQMMVLIKPKGVSKAKERGLQLQKVTRLLVTSSVGQSERRGCEGSGSKMHRLQCRREDGLEVMM